MLSENTKEKFTGKNEKNSEEYSKPLISSMDIKCALRDYLNTEMGNKNNSQINYNSKLKLNNEELELRDSNEKLKENKNKIILPSDLNNQKLIPNNGINTEFRNDNSLNSKNINSSERELFDRIRQQEGKGGYVKNKLRRLVFNYLFIYLFFYYFGVEYSVLLYKVYRGFLTLLCFSYDTI